MTARSAAKTDPSAARLRGRCPLAVAAAAVIASLAIAGVALASPATGKFHTTNGLSFSFSIKKGRCPGAPDPNNPSAPAGSKKRGLCFSTPDDPPVNMTCQAPASISGEQALLDSLSGLRLSANGTLVAKAYGYEGSTIVGYTELSLKVVGKKASGFVDVTDSTSDGTNTYDCDSGQLPFTAQRG
jgi:hypothetical protein